MVDRLPEHLLHHILAEWVGSLRDWSALDKAWTCAKSRPTLRQALRNLSDMRTDLNFLSLTPAKMNLYLTWASLRETRVRVLTVNPTELKHFEAFPPSFFESIVRLKFLDERSAKVNQRQLHRFLSRFPAVTELDCSLWVSLPVQSVEVLAIAAKRLPLAYLSLNFADRSSDMFTAVTRLLSAAKATLRELRFRGLTVLMMERIVRMLRLTSFHFSGAEPLPKVLFKMLWRTSPQLREVELMPALTTREVTRYISTDVIVGLIVHFTHLEVLRIPHTHSVDLPRVMRAVAKALGPCGAASAASPAPRTRLRLLELHTYELHFAEDGPGRCCDLRVGRFYFVQRPLDALEIILRGLPCPLRTLGEPSLRAIAVDCNALDALAEHLRSASAELPLSTLWIRPTVEVAHQQVAALLSHHGRELRELGLIAWENLPASVLMDLPKCCPQLRVLDVVDCGELVPSAVPALAMLSAFEARAHLLSYLRLGGSWMTDEVVFTMARVCPRLQVLHLVARTPTYPAWLGGPPSVSKRTLLTAMKEGAWADTLLTLDRSCHVGAVPAEPDAADLLWVAKKLLRADIQNRLARSVAARHPPPTSTPNPNPLPKPKRSLLSAAAASLWSLPPALGSCLWA